MTQIGIKTKISPIVLVIFLSFSSISTAETKLPEGMTYSLRGLSVVDYCLKGGCLEQDLDKFIREMKNEQIQSLYCNMSSPFQANEENSINLIINKKTIYKFAVEGYAFRLAPVRSQWNTKSISIFNIIEETDNLFELNRETLNIVENGNPLGRYEYKCALIEFEILARKLEKFIQDSKKANKI